MILFLKILLMKYQMNFHFKLKFHQIFIKDLYFQVSFYLQILPQLIFIILYHLILILMELYLFLLFLLYLTFYQITHQFHLTNHKLYHFLKFYFLYFYHYFQSCYYFILCLKFLLVLRNFIMHYFLLVNLMIRQKKVIGQIIIFSYQKNFLFNQQKNFNLLQMMLNFLVKV